ncbi:MAG: hypothetical protein Unbinned6242contig1001_33 [Prokaryotic dsDNA virus sp.]|nr:MAG: hypothetical protein Unbinned6242contig1001_33 [Prokaryotic dsDNA virus sp.]
MSKYEIKIYDGAGNLKKIIPSKTEEEILKPSTLPSYRPNGTILKNRKKFGDRFYKKNDKV